MINFIDKAIERLEEAIEDSRKIAFVSEQGMPHIGIARCIYRSKKIRLIEIETKTKNCQYDGYYFSDNENIKLDISNNELNNRHGQSDETLVEICDSNGWDVFAVEIIKYSINVCLTRKIK